MIFHRGTATVEDVESGELWEFSVEYATMSEKSIERPVSLFRGALSMQILQDVGLEGRTLRISKIEYAAERRQPTMDEARMAIRPRAGLVKVREGNSVEVHAVMEGGGIVVQFPGSREGS